MMRLTFIVIDDSELDRFILRRVIEHLSDGYEVITYRTAWEALVDIEKIERETFTMIFLDLKMPVMDGFQFIEEFGKLPEHIKDRHRIVILSTTRNPTDIARLMDSDLVDSIVEKPITKEKFNSLLGALNTTAL